MPSFAAAADDYDAPVYVISIAAQLSGLHPQTLRQYDRLGLVSPGRSEGRGRRYSTRDIVLLREVQRLSQEEGINLAGIKRILELETHVEALRARLEELHEEVSAARAALRSGVRPDRPGAADGSTGPEAAGPRPGGRLPVPVRGGTALVVWRPPPRAWAERPSR